MLFLPIMSRNINGIPFPVLYTWGVSSTWDLGEFMSTMIQPIYPLLVSNIAVALICFINIFNYKKRSFQKRFAIISIILIVGFAFLCGVYAQKVPGGIEGASFGVGTYLPALAILFVVLGIFSINEDENLIRSAERLR